jgi:hypothetical protein
MQPHMRAVLDSQALPRFLVAAGNDLFGVGQNQRRLAAVFGLVIGNGHDLPGLAHARTIEQAKAAATGRKARGR